MVFPVVTHGYELEHKEGWAKELMLSNCGVREDSWESLGLQGCQTNQSWRKSTLNIHWKDWCWSLSSNTVAIWCKELTHWKRPWCYERLKAGREGDNGDKTIGWHHRLNGHEFEQAPGDGEGQESLACCSTWAHKESDMTKQLNSNIHTYIYIYTHTHTQRYDSLH